MRIILFLSVMLFIFSGCQGRGYVVSPPQQNHQKIASKKTEVEKNQKEDIRDDFPTLKLKEKSIAQDESLFTHIPIVNKISSSLLPPIDKIPVLKDIKKLLPQGSKRAKSRLNKQNKRTFFQRRESFSGGKPINGLDIGMVRLGQSSHYTRLIFDSYRWEGYAQLPVKKVNDSGTYIFTYEPENNRIVGILDGYQAFSALVGDHSDLYEGNTMVNTIHIDEYLDKSGFKFTIELKQKAKINVYELYNPARIIIDLAPLKED